MPLSVAVSTDIELQSRAVIPAGAILATPVQLIHENGIYWGEDADIFNPDRFLKDSNVSTEALASKQLYKSNHDVQEDPTAGGLKLKSAYLAFGAGSRSCIGSNLALKQISTLVAVILQRFEVNILLASLFIFGAPRVVRTPIFFLNIISALQDE